jgi:serine/threonine protein kinase
MIGSTLAHYQINSHLGSGGMGDVYQATDTKLGRSVAIKFLPEAFSHDAERVARFQREARVLASLNHPNIAGIHGLEEINGHHFLIMELVPGETLANRIERGAIPLDEALPLAKQIAVALEEAHEKGVIHRDLKPANIKVTADGKVKVLDFGLAKAYDDTQSDAALTNSPTLMSMAATNAGIILGTAAYMSPEQARGKVVDKRTDIWAFGVVFYEMLTGRQAFQGEDLTETLASVVMKDVDLNAAPPNVRRLLAKCLQKDPRKRLRDIGDVWDYIDTVEAVPQPVQPVRPTGSKLPYILSLAAIAAAVAFWALWRGPAPEPQLARFEIAPPEKVTFNNFLLLSPDGKQLAFVANSAEGNQIWVRSLDTLKARPVATWSQNPAPFWSPDSQFIVFQQDGKLKKVDIGGGPPVPLTDAPTNFGGGAWSPNGTIVFGDRNGPLKRVSSAGGIAEPLTRLDQKRGEFSHSFPSFLPDGKHFVYLRRSGSPENSGVFIGSIDATPEQQDSKPLILTTNTAVYTSVPDPRQATRGLGFLLFLREDALMAQPFDAAALSLKGEPIPVGNGVGTTGFGYGRFTTSRSGGLAYIQGGFFGGGNSQLTWFDRQGKSQGIIGPPGSYQSLSISPDGARVAADMVAGMGRDIWLIDSTPGGKSDRFTFDTAGIEESPLWSPDGKQILYATGREKGNMTLFLKPSNLGGDAVELYKMMRFMFPTDWSRNGKTVMLSVAPSMSAPLVDIWYLSMDPAGKALNAEPVIKTDRGEERGRLSPDGRWLAYQSDATGRYEIYVQPFPRSSERSGQVMVSNGVDGKTQPLWNRNGKELFYRTSNGAVMAVDVSLGETFKSGQPKMLFMVPQTGQMNGPMYNWDVSPDGSKFLINVVAGAAEAGPPQSITLVQNWTSGLK